jgi:hypothetical protein
MAVKKVRNLLPPDVEFYEDIRLVVWRPRGLLNSAALSKNHNCDRRTRDDVEGAF